MSILGSREFYDQFASTYDGGFEKYWFIQPYVEQEISRFPKNQSTLVIGVGTGQELAPLVGHGIEEIEAIDLSPKMLAVAKGKYPGVLFQEGDFMVFTEFQKKSYDLIIACGVVELFEDAAQFLKRASDLLKPGGTMLLTFTPLLPAHPVQRMAASPHPDYPGHVERRHRFEDFFAHAQDADLSLLRCFTFQCYISGNNDIKDLCFFCALGKLN